MDKGRYIFFLVLPVLASLLAGPTVAADTPIEARREELEDTAFIDWLGDFEPSTKESKLTRWEILTGSKLVEENERLDYYRKWTEHTGEINQPADQIELAVRAGKEELVESWLEIWLDAPAVDRSELTDVVDLFLETRRFERGRQVIEQARQMFADEHLYHRRLAANYYARGKHRAAVEEYLRVARDRGLNSRLRHRLQVTVNQAGLAEFFINKVAGEAEDMAADQELILLAVDFIAGAEFPDKLLPDLLDISGDTEFIISQLENIRERFLEIDRPKLAGSTHRRLAELRPLEGDDLQVEAEIKLKMQRADSALQTLAEAEKLEVEPALKNEIDRLKFRAHMFNNSYDSAAGLLEDYPSTDKMLEEEAELLKVKNNYEALERLSRKAEEDFPWLEFYSVFMQGGMDTKALERLVQNEADKPETALALALSALAEPEKARDFLAWLDQFPFDKKIDMLPPAKFYAEQRQLPLVLVECWFSRFDAGERDPVELAEVGRNISFPPLLLAAARRYRDRGQTGRAREVLEEILTEYPETLLRPDVEEKLSQLSNGR